MCHINPRSVGLLSIDYIKLKALKCHLKYKRNYCILINSYILVTKWAHNVDSKLILG